MLVKIFRQIDEDGKPTGVRGFVVGRTMLEIFWAIDEFINPYETQIATPNRAGVCYFLEDDELDAEDHSISEELCLCYDQDRKWRSVDWKRFLDPDLRDIA